MTSDATFLTQTNNTNKILAQMLFALQNAAIVSLPAAGSVGSYALAKSTATTTFGASVAGTALTPSNAAGTSVGSALVGTWQCMGVIGTTGDVSLFVRIS